MCVFDLYVFLDCIGDHRDLNVLTHSVPTRRSSDLYLRIAYRADEPVHIWARPWFQGRGVAAGSNPSPRYDAGSGEALGWFFLDPGQQVDEVRIREIGRAPV